MPQNQNQKNKIQEKFEKTTKVVAAVNLMLLPLYVSVSKFSLLVSLIVNAALLHYFESLGKSRRPGLNALTSIQSFFSTSKNPESNELYNRYRNVINGGAAVYDELAARFFVPR